MLLAHLIWYDTLRRGIILAGTNCYVIILLLMFYSGAVNLTFLYVSCLFIYFLFSFFFIFFVLFNISFWQKVRYTPIYAIGEQRWIWVKITSVSKYYFLETTSEKREKIAYSKKSSSFFNMIASKVNAHLIFFLQPGKQGIDLSTFRTMLQFLFTHLVWCRVSSEDRTFGGYPNPVQIC